MNLHTKLVSLRKEKGLTQLDLSERLNVSRQAISRWEVGTAVPSIDNLKVLSDLYGVPVDYLLDDNADSFDNDPQLSAQAINLSATEVKTKKQRIFYLCLTAFILCGCNQNSIVVETTYPAQTPSTLQTCPTELPRDYSGESPSSEELCAYFTEYCYNSVKARMTQDEIIYCGNVDNYAVVFLSGMGPYIGLYEFTYADGTIQVLSTTGGEIALSGGLSVNHIEREGLHLYFGTCSDYHWNSIEEVTFPIEWLSLRVVDENGKDYIWDMSDNIGYLFILDAPLADFQIIDQANNVLLDYATFIEQNYYVNEAEFYLPE